MQVFRTVKCEDNVVLLARKETVIQGTTDKTNLNWKMLWNGNECAEK